MSEIPNAEVFTLRGRNEVGQFVNKFEHELELVLAMLGTVYSHDSTRD